MISFHTLGTRLSSDSDTDPKFIQTLQRRRSRVGTCVGSVYAINDRILYLIDLIFAFVRRRLVHRAASGNK